MSEYYFMIHHLKKNQLLHPAIRHMTRWMMHQVNSKWKAEVSGSYVKDNYIIYFSSQQKHQELWTFTSNNGILINYPLILPDDEASDICMA